MNRIELGLLDLGVTEPQKNARESIDSVLFFSRLGEELGYKRYWIAEHHEANSSYCAPEVLLGWLAHHTSKIRLGAAGMLLRYRDPYLTGQAFSLLCSLFPCRIDLGVARGSIGGQMKEYFARQDTSPAALENKCAQLARIFHLPSRVSFLRPQDCLPELWLMGGKNAAMLAARTKMKFCFDCFFQLPEDEQISSSLQQYVQTFKTHSLIQDPEYAVAIAGICAENEEQARVYLQGSAVSGFPIGLIKPAIVGTPETWRTYLVEKSKRWGVSTFIVLIASLDHDARECSMKLIAQAMSDYIADSSLSLLDITSA